MADPLTPTIDQQPVVKSRQDAWAEMGTQNFGPTDIPLPVAQVDEAQAYDTTPHVGILNAFVKGTPNVVDSAYQTVDPSYIPTTGEAISSALTQFIRSGTSVAFEALSPERKAVRESLAKLRETNPETADQIESSSIGKELSGAQLTTKGAASIGEGLMTFLPFFKVGRAAMAVGEAATLREAGMLGKTIEESATLSKLYSGGLNGALYGGLYGLHAHDGDWSEGAKNALMGGAFGAGLMGAGMGLAFIGKYGGNKTLEGFRFGTEKGSELMKGISERYPDSVVFKLGEAIGSSVGARISRHYGEIGDNFIEMYKGASREATKDLGRIQLSLIENGLMKPPFGVGKTFKGVEYVGENPELMSYYNQVLRGQGAYADQLARTAAIEADPRLQLLDGLRKHYGATALKEGVVEKLLNVDTYLPKHTPIIQLGENERLYKLSLGSTRKKLASATTDAERLAVYEASDPMVKEMIDNAVMYDKGFNTKLEAYQTYYDYADLVSGGAHTPIGDNKFLQKMVNDGQARTIEEAKGKVIADMKFRKKSLTPMAGSLDFKREVDLPWYDPNPSRVMPQYTFDAAMRIEMAKRFGARDEKIHEMLGSVKADLTRGGDPVAHAKKFEEFIRMVTGQIEHAPANEKISATMRAFEVPKLAFAQIINLGQSLNTLLASDLGSVSYGLGKAFSDEGTRKAIESGVLTNHFIRQIFDYNSGGGKVADNILKYSGFTYTEMFNRVVAANASNNWVGKNLEKVLLDAKAGGGIVGDKTRAYAALSELGLDVENIIARGSMTNAEKAVAAQAFVEKTQFLGRPIDLPYFASTPQGKVLAQFKTFAYQQVRFIYNEMKNSAKRGDTARFTRNILILGTVFPMTGEVLGDIRSLITQEKRPTKALDRYFADIASAGTFGLFADFLKSAETGKTMETLAGPSIGDAIRYLEMTVQAPGKIAEGKGGKALEGFTKQLLRQTGVARPAVNIIWPQSIPGETTLESLNNWAAD